MERKLKILIIEDLASDVILLKHEIRRSGIDFTDQVVETREDFLESLRSFSPDIILSDYSLPRFDGMKALRIRNEKAPDLPFILVTGSTNEEIAVECMKAGANDYLIKDKLNRIGYAINTALASARQVEKRKETEKALKESENKYRTIFENIQDVFYQVDQNGIIREISPSIFRYSGYTREELIGKPVEEVYLDISDRDKLMEVIREKGEAADYDIQLKTKDGKIRWASLNIHAQFDNQGIPIGIEGSLRDITSRKQIEVSLAESEEKFRTLAESSPYAIMIYQNDYWVYTNPAGIEICEYTADELYRMKFWEIVSKEYQEMIIQNGRRRQQGDARKSTYEFKIRVKSGREKWVFLSGSVFPYKGKPAGIISVVDISDRKQMEMKLEASRDQALESERLKSSFLANMSHEIRTPMNAILGFTELLGQPDSPRGEQLRFIEIIRNSGKRLMHILDDIIDLSKLESRQLKILQSPCNIPLLLETTVDSFINSGFLKKKPGVILLLDIPDPDSVRETETDNIRLQQVLDNLITNAIKYTNQGKITLSCKRQKMDGKELFEFSVKDTGKGIPLEKQSIIFTRFRQVEENEYREGAGLGLSISKALVELMGGEIRVNSEPGKGSVFSFTIPYIPVKNNHPTDPSPVEELAYNFSGKTILVAEDDEDTWFFLSLLLRETGATLLHAWNGEMLLEMLDKQPPDLVLLDINMPGKTGIECMKEIREKKYVFKVIAQTAYAMADEKQRCLEAGCDGYLAKPFTRAMLYECIASVLR